MAFLKKVGNVLKQSSSNPSLSMAIRSMSTFSKIFVGGLPNSTDDMSLSETFSKYGEVVEARVIIDHNTGRSRGFAFVTFTSSEAASSAIQAFDGQELYGRKIKVNYATEKSHSGGFDGSFNSSDGCYQGGLGGNYGGGSYQGDQESNLKTYLVHVELPLDGPQPDSITFDDDLDRWYHSFLPKTTNSSSNEEPRIKYCYHVGFRGFAAIMSPEHMKAMEKMPGFVWARPERMFHLHNTNWVESENGLSFTGLI
ncbi:uncharacterized protein [Henckelia pumila]|uniref:uncharacterized protein n=1 Tax=Henckelia pumila TaxID=405737 RepID=UPI003C6E0860